MMSPLDRRNTRPRAGLNVEETLKPRSYTFSVEHEENPVLLRVSPIQWVSIFLASEHVARRIESLTYGSHCLEARQNGVSYTLAFPLLQLIQKKKHVQKKC
jgi:hypothetical protein